MIKIKPKTNLLIDVILMLLLMAMTGLGLLIKYVLVPGFKRNDIYGTDVELNFIGFDRHQWGTVHLWVSFIFIFMIIIHIIFHWRMIVCIFRQMISGKATQGMVVVAIIIFTLLLSVAPLLLKPEIVPSENHHLNHHITTNENIVLANTFLENNKLSETSQHEISVHSGTRHKKSYNRDKTGSITLTEYAHKYNVSATELAKSLGVPETMCSERIGRLKRIYGFEIETLKNKIDQLKTNKE